VKKVSISEIIGIIGSIVLLLLPIQAIVPVQLNFLESLAVVTSAWSVWLLAKNNSLGWWIGLVGVVAYGFVFYQVKLYADVAIQVFYFITSCQAIYIWLRGGANQTPKPVERVPQKILLVSAILAILGVLVLRAGLIALRGAVPFWDALTTVLSAIAQLYLMERYLESWYLWIAVDTIYVPLYASRELYLTSFLYGVFWLLAMNGLRYFKRLYREQQLQAEE
jgi:nicotinamide mononucleotide transporter